MTKTAKPRPAYQERFEEIARLEAALRTGELSGQAAIDALHRVYELMNWQAEPETIAADIEYLLA